MKLAIMQPYFFPYIGYFQLVNAADKLVFYDDVNYINRGWINRNKVLVNGKPTNITVQLKGASQNKLINEIEFIDNRPKIAKTLYLAYKKAPCFEQVWSLIEDVFDHKTETISDMAAYTVKKTCEYLGVNTSFEFSSQTYADTSELRKEERLIEICKRNNVNEYINPIGGTELYEKTQFAEHGINLRFLKTKPLQYEQFGGAFISNLSIVDVMMFKSKEEIKHNLHNYKLV